MHRVFLTYSNHYLNREYLALPRVSSESDRKAKIFASCQPTEEQFRSRTELITNWIQPKSVSAVTEVLFCPGVPTCATTAEQPLHPKPRHSATQQVQLLHWADLISQSEDQRNTQGCRILTEFWIWSLKISTWATKYEDFNVFTFQTAFNDGTLGVLVSMPWLICRMQELKHLDTNE